MPWPPPNQALGAGAWPRAKPSRAVRLAVLATAPAPVAPRCCRKASRI